MSDWIAIAEDKLLSVAPDVDPSIKPEDSVSNVGSQVRSSTSKHLRHSNTLGIFRIFLTTPPVFGHARKDLWVEFRTIPQWTLRRSGAY